MAAFFQLDGQLAKDTIAVKQLQLCDMRLMNDARFLWLVLVPQRNNVSEIFDLTPDDQTVLWQEITQTSQKIKLYGRFDKINVAALGNMVPQLHVHIIGRNKSDAAWPKPVWGQGEAMKYSEIEYPSLIKKLQDLL